MRVRIFHCKFSVQQEPLKKSVFYHHLFHLHFHLDYHFCFYLYWIFLILRLSIFCFFYLSFRYHSPLKFLHYNFHFHYFYRIYHSQLLIKIPLSNLISYFLVLFSLLHLILTIEINKFPKIKINKSISIEKICGFYR